MAQFHYNPFHDVGITNYEQFKQYPCLVFGTLGTIKNRIHQQIEQVQNGYYFGERLIILGTRGIGKTSALFFIKDMLEGNHIRAEIFSRLVEDGEHLNTLLSQNKNPRNKAEVGINNLSKNSIYFLVDFPDTIENKNYKKFLSFLWSLMTHKNYNKINLIFAMNKSHYEKSFSFSEILGKFLTQRLEKFDREETQELIEARLKLVNVKTNIFPNEVLDKIYTYSKGIPRNIISACSLLYDNGGGNKISKKKAEKVLKERYIDQVINDRVEDLELKKIYKQMVNILEKSFNGTVNNQENYIKKVMDTSKIGRNSVLARIADLARFGIISQYRGGYNRVNKIISLK